MSDTNTAGKIAIIGMACRFAGVETTEGFWDVVLNGRETLHRLSDEALRAAGVPDKDIQDPRYVKVSGSLLDADRFDPAFFNMTPREANYMDPQQRVFLECCQEAFEDAGYIPSEVGATVGVFGGSAVSTYLLHQVLGSPDKPGLNRQLHEFAHGNDKDFLTANVAYRLDLQGPCMSINAACSTGLLSVVQACKALLSYDCDYALAGAVRIELPAHIGYLYQEGGILSPTGRCHPFDSRAAGTIFTDGAGAFLLKRLEDAQADGDHIHAIVSGFAVNNDGAGKAGFSAPSESGQARLLHEALGFAGVDCREIGYLEAHGTGTAIGDPIEFRALQQAFPAADGRPYCALGSVKANVGHLNSAAGVAGLIKAVKVLQHRVIPPQINFEQPNAEIDLAGSAFYIPTSAREWPRDGAVGMAGVSCFGMGGTNVHVVLEEPPVRERARPAGGPALLVLSARSEAALERQRTRLLAHLQANPELALDEVAYTLQEGREQYAWRAALACASLQDAAAWTAPLRAQPARATGAMFLLPDSQVGHAAMGHGLYRALPAFRAAVDRCLTVLDRDPAGLPVRQLFQQGSHDGLAPAGAKASLFTLQYAMCDMWASLGVAPSALAGYGVGEFVAACITGVMSLEDSLTLVRLRATARAEGVATPQAHGEALVAALRRVRLAAPSMPLLSAATGTWIGHDQATDTDYWAQRVLAPVAPVQGLDIFLRSRPDHVPVEIGPGSALSDMARQHGAPFEVVSTLGDGGEDNPLMSLLDAVGRVWQSGLSVNWRPLRDGRPLHRVPLPTYSFDRQRCWVDSAPQSPLLAAPASVMLPTEEWTSVPSWQHTHLPLDMPASAPRNILLFCLDADGGLAHSLRERGHRVKVVRPGQAFSEEGGEYRVRPHERGDFERLAHGLRGTGWQPGQVIHAWTGSDANDCAPGDEALDLGLIGLMHIAQIMTPRLAGGIGDLRIVTERAVDIDGNGNVDPVHAMLTGAVRVLSNELAGVSCQCIDSDFRTMAGTGAALLRELDTPVSHPLIVLRHGRRWREFDESVRLATHAPQSTLLPHAGTYMITGGLGGLGAELAKWLARRGKVRLVLLGRSAPADDKLVQELNGRGAEVMVLSVDVTQRDALEKAVLAAEARFGRLHGVFHLAGRASSGTIATKSRATALETMSPKVRGTHNLAAVLASRQPGFVMLFSSIAALTGAAGQFEYAAANAFLDAFAQRMDDPTGCRWSSINWDTWRDAGMAVNIRLPAYLASQRERELAQAVGSAEGFRILEGIFNGGFPVRLAVSTRPLGARRSATRTLEDLDMPDRWQAQDHSGHDAKARIAAIWSHYLGHDHIGDDDDFFELGGDSLIATRVVGAINEAFAVGATVTDLLEIGRLAEFAEFIVVLSGKSSLENSDGLECQLW